MMTFTKTLGQTEAKFLADLASQDKAIFTTDDARAVTGSSVVVVDLLIAKLVKKKWLIRLTRGVYLIVPLSAGEAGEYSENWYVVAKHLIEPADYYLSHFSALEIHQMTTQPVLTVYISTPVRRIPKEIAGATYRFIAIKREGLWGLEDTWATPSERVKASDLERTILDCLDRPDLSGGIIEVARGLWAVRDRIDYVKLIKYTERLGRKTVVKRLGFLLEVLAIGTPESVVALKRFVTASYTLLDPTLPAEGRYVAKWRVRVNIDPDELKSATTT
ncbi:MAG: type IV toxin-antitoxin system AbiEi family antitoxin domain-containing protein [Coriobacteriia bacterium]|nr:type IV toxin-antitoxin system AbiEi family antitoxin domain-containing protein [Coriobacteriia bacterium]